MSRDFRWTAPPTQESVSRLVNFTDAVVGIAATLLVLPLLDIDEPGPGSSIWHVMRERQGTILAFVLSFAITLVFWRRHHRIFDGLRSFTPALVALNLFWLGALVFLQYPTNALGNVGALYGVITLYDMTLGVLTALTLAILIYLRSRPDLMPRDRLVSTTQLVWGFVDGCYIVALGILGLWQPTAALWLMFGLLPLGWLERAHLSIQKRRQAAPNGASRGPESGPTDGN